MKPFELPASLLVALFAFSSLSTASPTSPITQLPSTGSGPEYAKACSAERSSYTSRASEFSKKNEWVSTLVEDLGGTSFSYVNYLANASTLCDGHPRVATSTASYTTLSAGTLTRPGKVTGKTTLLQTYNSFYSAPAPTCSISPADCDPLWAAYLSDLARPPQVTSPPLSQPPCANQTFASTVESARSQVYGCGACTIYGSGVQLVFWPPSTTVERDMCASTPTANVTHYGPSAVITAYAGKSVGNHSDGEASNRGYATVGGKETIVADGHIFTAGTAYISISKVYAVDRCSKTFGAAVTDAILAMPSESVLSLRYSQDKFQRFGETDKITGYPVNYADFQTPIPWSAWNGQNLCLNAQDNFACSVINEDFFRPQLAIPPQITDLSPDFKNCQMWYNGLWDPPLALQEADEVAKPTLPSYYQPTSSPASPSSTIAAPTATATAVPNERPTSTAVHSSSRTTESTLAAPTLPVAKVPVPSNEPWATSFDLNGETYIATGRNKQAVIGDVTCVSDGPAQTLTEGVVVSYGSNGCVFRSQTTVSFEEAQPTNGPSTPDADTVFVSFSGTSVLTVVQTSDGGVVVAGAHTLTPGADDVTLEDGHVLTAATNRIVVLSQSTLGVTHTYSASEPGTSQQSSSSVSGGSTASTKGETSATADAAQTSLPPSTGSSAIPAPAFTSFLMVLFVAGVMAI